MGTTDAACVLSGTNPQLNQLFTQMYSYTSAGQIAGKRLRYGLTTAGTDGGPSTTNTDWDTGYTYDGWGKPVGTTYPNPVMDGTPWTTYKIGYDAQERPVRLTASNSGNDMPRITTRSTKTGNTTARIS